MRAGVKAIQLVKCGRSRNAFRIKELPDPTVKDGEVRIQTEISGLNFADVLARLGLYPEAPPLPFVPGYDVVGRVNQVGKHAGELKEGDRVVALTRFGGYANQVVARAVATVKITEEMNPCAAAALATQYTTAWHASEDMVNLYEKDRVLIQAAAGGVGLALVQLARRKKCEIFGTAGSEEKCKFLSEQGVDHPINYNQKNFQKEVKKILGKYRLDVVFDSIGGDSFRNSLKLLGPGGRLVFYGAAQMAGKKKNLFRSVKTLTTFGWFHPLYLLTRSKSVIGINLLKLADYQPRRITRAMNAVVQLATRGELKPMVGKVFPAVRIEEAHEYLGLRKSMGKVGISWEGL